MNKNYKKTTALLLGLTMIIGLSACSNNTANNTSTSTNISTTESVEQEVTKEIEKETTEETNVASNNKETYELSGTLTEQFVVDTDKDVVITLNNVDAKLEDSVIKIESAKSATIILVGESTLESYGDLEEVGPKVISSDVDLTIKGEGTLNITSSDTCIKSEENLTIESGTYNLQAVTDGNGLRADGTLTVNGGTFNIDAGECLEATYVIVNNGEFNLNSDDDAINASDKKESGETPRFELNGGTITINMTQGDTDGVDSNGDIIINGGTISINSQSAFDWDGNLEFNDGTVIINGEEVKDITNQFGGEGVMPPMNNNEHPEGGMQGNPPDGQTPPNMQGTPPDGNTPPDMQNNTSETP